MEQAKCRKCGKDMVNHGGTEAVATGLNFEIALTGEVATPENISYYNKQLGKYSNGQGGCKVEVCLECYIDGLLAGGADANLLTHQFGRG